MTVWFDKGRKTWRYAFQYLKHRYAEYGFDQKDHAVIAEIKARQDAKAHPILTPTDMAYSVVLARYLDFAKKEYTLNTYRQKTRACLELLKFLGKDLDIRKITTPQILFYLETLSNNNKFNTYRRDISTFFNYAISPLELLEINPVSKIKKRRYKSKRTHATPTELISRILNEAEPETEAFLKTIIYTAARVGEIYKLQWKDVDLDNKILIKWTRKRSSKELEPIPIAINTDLLYLLSDLKKQRTQDIWVFLNPRTQDRYRARARLMRGLCKRAGIVPHFGFHELRHYAASIMARNPKTSLRSVQEILGHKDIQTTQEYVHVYPSDVKNALGNLEGLF